MIASARGFADYFDGVRRRTVAFFRAIPAERIDWAPKAGEYTCGDIVRHVTATERMFVGVVCDGRWTYPGHERASAPTLEAALADLEAAHEVHHRSQLASYLTWMGLEAPDIFGLGVEDVERLTASTAGRIA